VQQIRAHFSTVSGGLAVAAKNRMTSRALSGVGSGRHDTILEGVRAATAELQARFRALTPEARVFDLNAYETALIELDLLRRALDQDRTDEAREAFEIARSNAAIAAVLFHARMLLELVGDLGCRRLELDASVVKKLASIERGTPPAAQLGLLGARELGPMAGLIHQISAKLRDACALASCVSRRSSLSAS
jgi:hypothetical protein